MAIPAHLIEYRFKHVDCDQAYAMLDQPAGEQAGLAERVLAVARAEAEAFLFHSERLLRLRMEDDAKRRICLNRLPEVRHFLKGALGAVHGLDTRRGTVEAGEVEARYDHFFSGTKRFMFCSQVTGGLAMAHAYAGVADRARQDHKGRQLLHAPAAQMGKHR